MMNLERARHSVAFCICRLREQTTTLKNHHFPGNHPGPKLWLGLVIGLLDTAENFLSDASVSIDDTITANLIRDSARLGTMAYKALSLTEGVSADDLAYPLVQPLQRWIDRLGLTNTIVFRAEVAANYEIRPLEKANFSRIRNPSQSLQEAINKIRWPLMRVTVPSKAFAIIPHFSIVAHEIGHALFDEVQWDLTSYQGEHNNFISRLQTRLNQAVISPIATNAANTVFVNWFQELAADAFAYFLTGPAIFFSLSDFLQLLGGGYGLSQTHPANDLRRKALFEQLTVSNPNFNRVFRKHTGQDITEDFNSPILTRTPDSNTIFADARQIGVNIEMAAVLAELHVSIPLVIPLIYQQVDNFLRQRAPDLIYTADKFDEDLEHHLKPILSGIPPIETPENDGSMRPTDFSTILNVGWVVVLTKLSELITHPDVDRVQAVHEWLLKAVELSEVRRLWESV